MNGIYGLKDPSNSKSTLLLWGYAPTLPVGQQISRALYNYTGQNFKVGNNVGISQQAFPRDMIPIYLNWQGRRYYYGHFKPSPTYAIIEALPMLVGGEIDRRLVTERMALL